MNKNELIKKALRVKVGKEFKYAKEIKELGLTFEASGWSQQGYYALANNELKHSTQSLVISTDYGKKSRLFGPYSLVFKESTSIKQDLEQDLARELGV